MASNVNQRNGSTLRLGILGCGEVTECKHLPALRRVPEIQVAALCDCNVQQAQRVADAFNIARCHGDYQALLSDDAIDAVAVCVPAHSHARIALAALQAGKHVFVEKPLALCLDDCDRLIERAATSNCKVMVGFHMRRHRLVQQARAAIEQGRLGALEAIRTTWNSPIVFDDSRPDWRLRRETGGGALVEIAVHHFDLWRFLMQSEVEEVFAQSRHEGAADETAIVTARLASGALASGFFSERTSHDIEVEIYGRAARWRASCLRFDGLECHTLASRPGSASTRLRQLSHTLRELPRGLAQARQGGDYLDSYREQWRHFAAAIARNAPLEPTLEDGRRALEIVLAATASASRREAITVREAPRHLLPVASPSSSTPAPEAGRNSSVP